MSELAVCLNMIVKDETPVLPRLLQSVAALVDHYVIVDTGSSDGTPELIRSWMDQRGIPGEVHCHDWVDFAFNRNQALEYAVSGVRFSHALFIDADEELVCDGPALLRALSPGTSYRVEKRVGVVRYRLPALVDIRNTRWEWQGVVHEALVCPDGMPETVLLDDAWIRCHVGEGSRSRGLSEEQKYLADAALLAAEWQRNPADARTCFYLAQSYHHAGHHQRAHETYRHRAAMNGWIEETFIARLRAGLLAEQLGEVPGMVLDALLQAHELCPARAEPLYELARYCRLHKRFAQAYLFASAGEGMTVPEDGLFVDTEVYDWRLQDELAVAAYWTGRYDQCAELCGGLLDRHRDGETHLDHGELARIQENYRLARQHL